MAAGCFTWWTNMRRVRDDLERRIVDAIMCEAWLVLCKMMRWWISSVASTNYEYLSSYLSKEWFPRPERDKSTQRLELLVSKRSCAKKKKKTLWDSPLRHPDSASIPVAYLLGRLIYTRTRTGAYGGSKTRCITVWAVGVARQCGVSARKPPVPQNPTGTGRLRPMPQRSLGHSHASHAMAAMAHQSPPPGRTTRLTTQRRTRRRPIARPIALSPNDLCSSSDSTAGPMVPRATA